MVDPNKGRQSTTQQIAPYVGLGLQLAAAMAAFGGLGWFADKKLGTQPWLLIAGLFLGAIGGMISLIRASLRASNQSKSRTTPK